MTLQDELDAAIDRLCDAAIADDRKNPTHPPTYESAVAELSEATLALHRLFDLSNAQKGKEAPYLSYLRAMALRGAQCADAHHVAMISQTSEEAAAVAVAMSQDTGYPKREEDLLAEVKRLMAVAS